RARGLRVSPMTSKRLSALLVSVTCVSIASGQVPTPTQGDFVIRNYRFASGETLPELRLHYRTFGKLHRDANGVVRNAVLILHSTGGSSNQYLGPGFAGELLKPGGLLDAERFFLILPDSIGHGQSSKPSDRLKARFPRYGYVDMVDAQYRLVTE